MAEEQTAVKLERKFETPGNGFSQPITEQYRKEAELVANVLAIKMNNWIPWYATGRMDIVSTTEDTIYSRKVRPGQIVVLTHVSAQLATTAPTTTEIWIERGGERLTLNRDVPSAADVSVDWDGQVLLGDGDRVGVSAWGGTSTNVFKASMSGYEIKA